MKTLKWFLIILALLGLGFLWFLWYMGVFSPVTVTEQAVGPYTLVYEEYFGPYSNAGKVINKVYNELKSEGIITLMGFGIYLNNPNNTAPDKLHSYLGCVLKEKDLAKHLKIKSKLKIMKWTKKTCLVVEFPIKNDLSYMLGPVKAYPELNKTLAAKGYKMGSCLELYDMPAGKALYIFEIIK